MTMRTITSLSAPLYRSVRWWVLERYWDAFPHKAPKRVMSCLRQESLANYSAACHVRDKDLKVVIKTAEAQGWDVTLRKAGHLVFRSLTGAQVFTGSSPSHRSSIRNLIGELRRAGLVI